MASKTPLVRAAGGVVIRHKKKGRKVAVIHRPRHKDWSLPKGKLDGGESWKKAAIREVWEETGVKAKVVHTLLPTAYQVGRKPKIVVWYAMEIVERGEFKPNKEVDQLRWVWEHELKDVLTAKSDYRVAKQALALVPHKRPAKSKSSKKKAKPKKKLAKAGK